MSNFLKQLHEKLSTCLVFAAVVIPVNNSQDWQILNFNKIPRHKVEFKESLNVDVKSSAGPIVYPLSQPVMVKNVEVEIEVEGDIKLPKDKAQGDKGLDDYLFRLGLVLEGERRLSWMQRQVAADWVLKLFKLAPEKVGIDHIYFLILGNQKAQLNRKRQHPLSDLLKEKVQWVYTGEKTMILKAKLDRPLKTLALWLASDGDDTKSEFKIKIKSLKLNPESGEIGAASKRGDTKEDPAKGVKK